MDRCVFCERVGRGETLHFDGVFASFWDQSPVSPGHALVVPIRHCEGFFDLNATEAAGLHAFIDQTRIKIEESFHPDAYNIGVNSGAAAGQTVFHLHVHLIPRYLGDVADPRGGIRGLFPAKARYWYGTED